jgi:hypothetical protein
MRSFKALGKFHLSLLLFSRQRPNRAFEPIPYSPPLNHVRRRLLSSMRQAHAPRQVNTPVPELSPPHMIPLSNLITSFPQPYILLRRMPGPRRLLSFPLHRILGSALPESPSHSTWIYTGASLPRPRHVLLHRKVGLPANLFDLV